MKNIILASLLYFTTYAQYLVPDKDIESKTGIEITLGVTNSIVSVPGAFSNINASGGGSFIGRIGIYSKTSEKFMIRGGLQKWSKDYVEEYENSEYTITTDATFDYFGLFAEALIYSDKGYFGIGAESSISSTFSVNEIKESQTNSFAPPEFVKQVEESFKDRVEQQFDIYFIAGLNMIENKTTKIIPSFKFSIPTKSLYDLGSDQYKINAFAWSFLINAQISL